MRHSRRKFTTSSPSSRNTTRHSTLRSNPRTAFKLPFKIIVNCKKLPRGLSYKPKPIFHLFLYLLLHAFLICSTSLPVRSISSGFVIVTIRSTELCSWSCNFPWPPLICNCNRSIPNTLLTHLGTRCYNRYPYADNRNLTLTIQILIGLHNLKLS